MRYYSIFFAANKEFFVNISYSARCPAIISRKVREEIIISGLTLNFDEDCKKFDMLCGKDRCFDLKKRSAYVCGRRTCFWYAGSLSNDLLVEQVIAFGISCQSSAEGNDPEEFAAKAISAGDVSMCGEPTDAADNLLDGNLVILVEGYECFFVCDTKLVPSRGISEPESDKVLRGSRDGFVEELMPNVALIRRRLKIRSLAMKKYTVGEAAKSKVILCYLEDRADPEYVKALDKRISSIKTEALSMGQESLAECLIKRAWYNPFPKFRYTERPDACAAMMMEGSVIVLCENSPQAMILPTAIFDFLQESDDFYFPPLVGSYLRILRLCIFFIALFLTPVWFLLTKHPDWVPEILSFILIEKEGYLPVIFQLLLVEFTIDGLKLASLNTPDSLSGSLSIVAGLIIGDFAITVGWLVPEVILYMSFAAMANYTQPSFELGYAFKFMRIMLLVLIALFDVWGFAAGLILVLLFVVLNKTADGKRGYLYPLIPWNKKAMIRQFVRPKKDN